VRRYVMGITREILHREHEAVWIKTYQSSAWFQFTSTGNLTSRTYRHLKVTQNASTTSQSTDNKHRQKTERRNPIINNPDSLIYPQQNWSRRGSCVSGDLHSPTLKTRPRCPLPSRDQCSEAKRLLGCYFSHPGNIR